MTSSWFRVADERELIVPHQLSVRELIAYSALEKFFGPQGLGLELSNQSRMFGAWGAGFMAQDLVEVALGQLRKWCFMGEVFHPFRRSFHWGR